MSQYKVRNWSDYSKSLTNRGNLFFWIDQKALKKWKACKDPYFIGAPRQYSDDAILCLLAIKIIFHQPYRQLIGLFTSLLAMMGVSLPLPHFTTVAARARQLGKHFKKLSSKRPTDLVFDSSGFKVYGEGEWKVRQHGKQKRRRWKKFHIAICPESHEIILAEATELEEMDCEVMPRLIKKSPRSVKQVIGDGAFDTANCYEAAHENGIALLTPPRQGAVHWHGDGLWEWNRNKAISEIAGLGGDDRAKKLWKKLRGYHKRSLVETAYSRLKGTFGGDLYSKRIDSQEVELLCKAAIMNRMTQMGMPDGVMI
jgi:hypothetical protein